jgi:hypothetical protein
MIRVYAQDQDDAITKIITAGALNCRKTEDQFCHENVMLSMELEG